MADPGPAIPDVVLVVAAFVAFAAAIAAVTVAAIAAIHHLDDQRDPWVATMREWARARDALTHLADDPPIRRRSEPPRSAPRS